MENMEGEKGRIREVEEEEEEDMNRFTLTSDPLLPWWWVPHPTSPPTGGTFHGAS